MLRASLRQSNYRKLYDKDRYPARDGGFFVDEGGGFFVGRGGAECERCFFFRIFARFFVMEL